MIAQSGRIPNFLIPYLAVILIIVCIYAMVVLLRDIKKSGLSKYHAVVFITLMSTIIVLGFGPSVWNDIRVRISDTQEKVERTNEIVDRIAKDVEEELPLMSSLFDLMKRSSTNAVLNHALSLANTEEDKKLAFRLYFDSHPAQAYQWANSPSNPLLTRQPKLVEDFKDEASLIIADKAAPAWSPLLESLPVDKKLPS